MKGCGCSVTYMYIEGTNAVLQKKQTARAWEQPATTERHRDVESRLRRRVQINDIASRSARSKAVEEQFQLRHGHQIPPLCAASSSQTQNHEPRWDC